MHTDLGRKQLKTCPINGFSEQSERVSKGKEGTMNKTLELCQAIAANNVSEINRLLQEDKSLADSTELTPPPIHCAVQNAKPEIVELLLDRGANIELKDQDRNCTPLNMAIMYGRKDIIPILVSRGANVEGSLELATRGAAGEFAEYRDVASPQEFEEVVELLRGLGVE